MRMFFRLCLVVWGAMCCASPILAQSNEASPEPAEAFRPGPNLEALRDYLRSRRVGPGAEESVGLPELPKGIPAPTLRAAQRYAASRNQTLGPEEAFDFTLRDVGAMLSRGDVWESRISGSPEAIVIIDAARRPALLVCRDTIDELIPVEWHERLNDRRAALARTLRSVGLLAKRRGPGFEPKGFGTAFVVAPGILMTNRHVAEVFAVPDGQGGWDIQANPFTGQPIEVTANFTKDTCGSAPTVFRVTEILHIEPKANADVALLRMAGQLPPVLSLQTEEIDSEELVDSAIYVAGFPFNDPRNPLWARMKVFGDVYGVKRVAPGRLRELSGQDLADGNAYLLHDASTLGGNSGSPVVDLQTNRVLGLHFAGTFQEANFAWPMWRILAIPEVQQIISSR